MTDGELAVIGLGSAGSMALWQAAKLSGRSAARRVRGTDPRPRPQRRGRGLPAVPHDVPGAARPHPRPRELAAVVAGARVRIGAGDPHPVRRPLHRRPERRLHRRDAAQRRGDGRAAHAAGRRGAARPVSPTPSGRRRRGGVRPARGLPADRPGGALGRRGRRERGCAGPDVDTRRRTARGLARRARGVRLVELDVRARHRGGGRVVAAPAAGPGRRRRRTPPDLPHLVPRPRARELHARPLPDLHPDPGRG